ncbi:MAG: hypothetical protein RL318_3095 [Fibrobacterota bacterium]|jgi:stage II sporulation protein D
MLLSLLATLVLSGCAAGTKTGRAPDSLVFKKPVTVGLLLAQKAAALRAEEDTWADGLAIAPQVLTASRAGRRVVLRGKDGAVLAEGPVLTLRTASPKGIGVGKIHVRGEVMLVPEGAAGVTAVNRLELEDYLKGVVPGEIGRKLSKDKLEAVKAQAVAARTYSLKKLGQYPGRAYDLLATVADQVYSGLSIEDTLCTQAIEATRGLYITDGNGYADAYFHSASGGRTSAIQDAWPSKPARPYLTGIVDSSEVGAWCRKASVYRWKEEWPEDALHKAVAKDLTEALGKNPGAKTVTGLRTEGRDSSGRVRKLIVEMEGETLSVNADRIRWALRRGPNRDILRSTRFVLKREDGRYIAEGSGNGHGVGMDQWGAMGRSQAGQDFATILKAYYPGTRLETLTD